jgi:hypothetical protein
VNTPTEHIIVTSNTDQVRGDLHAAYDASGLELVNSSPTSIIWRWYNASASDLDAIQGKIGYKGIVQVS